MEEQKRKEDSPTIKICWKDNGQIIMTIKVYPDELEKLNKLFEFIEATDFDL